MGPIIVIVGPVLVILALMWWVERSLPKPDPYEEYLALLPPERREALQDAEYRRKSRLADRDWEHTDKLRAYVLECMRERANERPIAILGQMRETAIPWGASAYFWAQFEGETPQEAFAARPVLYMQDTWERDAKPKYLRIANARFDESAPMCGEGWVEFMDSCSAAFTSRIEGIDGRQVGYTPRPSTWGRMFANV